MAAGLSMDKENVETFRRDLNAFCSLTEEDFVAAAPRAAMPLPEREKIFRAKKPEKIRYPQNKPRP